MTNRKIPVLAVALLGASALFTVPGITHADDNRQVWRDSAGNIVHERDWGTCVRQNSAMDDPCASPTEVQVRKRSVIAREDRTVYFDFNKSDLTEESKARLDALSEKLKSASDIQGADVAGYADRIGSVSYNQMLSKKRATVVRDYLVAHNVVNTNVVKTRWFGKKQQFAHCPNDLKRAELIQCLQPDRKVQVDIVYRFETTETIGQ